MKNIKSTVQSIKSASLTNNTQRVGLRLLSAEGEWVPRSRLTQVPSGTARVRDLRKEEFGGFQVECKSSDELQKNVSKKTYYYRINPNKVSRQQIDTLFNQA